MKRAGKERTKGVRVRRVLTCAGEFLSFFVFFSLSSCYCISSLFFIEEEVNDDFTWRKEHFLGKNSSLSFFETGFEYRWGSFVSIKIESSLLFFFGLQKHVRQYNVSPKKESLTPFLLKTKNTYAIRNTRFSRQAKYSFGSVSRRPDMNVGEAMAASGNVSFRFTLRF